MAQCERATNPFYSPPTPSPSTSPSPHLHRALPQQRVHALGERFALVRRAAHVGEQLR
jgi:hypothetical protein